MSQEETHMPKISLKIGKSSSKEKEEASIVESEATQEAINSAQEQTKKTPAISSIKLSLSSGKQEIETPDEATDSSPGDVETPAVESQAPRISLSSIISSNEAIDALQATKVQENKEKGEREAALKIQNKDLKDQEKKVFGNYESQFEKESLNFVERIKNFGKKPQTRIGFVIGVIMIAIGGVGALMILQPEKHSFSIYKANIIYMYQSGISGTTSESPDIGDVPLPENPEIKDIDAVTPETETLPVENPVKDTASKEELKKEKLREYLQNKK